MQIVSIGNNLHEMSKKPGKNKKNISIYHSAENFCRTAKG